MSYRYISCESCSQFEKLAPPPTSLTDGAASVDSAILAALPAPARAALRARAARTDAAGHSAAGAGGAAAEAEAEAEAPVAASVRAELTALIAALEAAPLLRARRAQRYSAATAMTRALAARARALVVESDGNDAGLDETCEDAARFVVAFVACAEALLVVQREVAARGGVAEHVSAAASDALLERALALAHRTRGLAPLAVRALLDVVAFARRVARGRVGGAGAESVAAVVRSDGTGEGGPAETGGRRLLAAWRATWRGDVAVGARAFTLPPLALLLPGGLPPELRCVRARIDVVEWCEGAGEGGGRRGASGLQSGPHTLRVCGRARELRGGPGGGGGNRVVVVQVKRIRGSGGGGDAALRSIEVPPRALHWEGAGRHSFAVVADVARCALPPRDAYALRVVLRVSALAECEVPLSEWRPAVR